MLPGSGGSLTVRQTWDEFHGPIAQAKRIDPAWPYTLPRKKLSNRRRKFINLIKVNAKGDQSIETVVDAPTVTHKGQSINSILQQLEKAQNTQGETVNEDD
ncbi:hypothetical protein BGZ50_009332 [Haplosporangium sp. Z 11]|nr:hypothetical protein BGZ50_009332 [Haplosporangium sp. Z 11]